MRSAARGELLLLEPTEQARAEAEAAFEHAIIIAASQGAKMLELRATTARARLCQERRESAKAFDLLAPLYSWFTEGLDTPDLLRAGGLLTELRRP